MSRDYRFLPWTRQGLAGQVATVDTLSDNLLARSRFPVRVHVNEGAPVEVDVTVYGPGDVIGVDPRGIVRTDPQPFASDVEPNYMAAIDFDRPDFPWMFTPAAAGTNERLRPWCVLIVVEKSDGVAVRPDRTRPLPLVTVRGDELPPLGESWAWAHTEVITEEATTQAIVANLENEPDLNVSRILCPRRLEPSRSYIACLVPAFAVGVDAGLGLPGSRDNLAPAWTGTENRVDLPVYFQWEFTTGPRGDFESLARKLTPPQRPLEVGIATMEIDGADPGLPPLHDESGVALFEGALVGPFHVSEPPIQGLPEEWLSALAAILDAPARMLTEDDLKAPAVSPPLYGAWQSAVHTVPGSEPRWFRELNLDPRKRAVAGLAAQVVRANQEELMHDAWSQVGEILAANRLLNLARFSREGARHLHRKMFQPLDSDELFRLAAPLLGRVVLDGSTIRARLHGSVVPDAIADPAFRRMASTGGRILRRAARSTDTTIATPIVAGLDAGTLPAQPGDLVPDGVRDAQALATLDVDTTEPVDLGPMGGKGVIEPTVLQAARTSVGDLAPTPTPSKVLLRKNLPKSGVILHSHLKEAVATSTKGTTVLASQTLNELVATSLKNPDAGGFLLPTETGDMVATLDISGDGTVSVRGSARAQPTVIGRVTPRRGGFLPTDELKIEMLPSAPGGDPRPEQPPGRTRPPRPPTPDTPTVPPLDKRPDVIDRLTSAFDTHIATFQEPPLPSPPPALGLGAVRTQILAKTDPDKVIPARVASMISIATDGKEPTAPIVTSPGTLQPFTGGPRLNRPMYEPLALYAPELLLPGIGDIPTNTVALVKVNPRFVESFLVGANSEFGDELLWRQYPTRRDGTPLRRFWDRTDGAPDIPEINTFAPDDGIGESVTGAGDGGVVLLIRGDLLRRYPTAVIYAAKPTPNGRLSNRRSDQRHPVFRGRIEPDVTFVGFDAPLEEALGDPGLLFVIQQQPTEPRFGFDVPETDEGSPATWRDATWAHVGVEPGAHLVIGGVTVTEPIDTGGTTFVTNAAHLAAITLQQPVRVAIHARDLIGTDH